MGNKFSIGRFRYSNAVNSRAKLSGGSRIKAFKNFYIEIYIIEICLIFASILKFCLIFIKTLYFFFSDKPGRYKDKNGCDNIRISL